MRQKLWKKLISIGVDGIITDRPKLLKGKFLTL